MQTAGKLLIEEDESLAYWCVVPAAGIGKRMGGPHPKQYLKIGGKNIIEITLAKLLDVRGFEGVFVGTAETDVFWPTLECAQHPRIHRFSGGEARANTVFNGLKALRKLVADDDWVLVHDVARPCVRVADIEELMTTLKDDPVGGLLAVRAVDTIKWASADVRVEKTLNRHHVWQAQTPQMFRYKHLYDALDRVIRTGGAMTGASTDESAAVEAVGLAPRLIQGDQHNIKVTHPGDLEMAGLILAVQASGGSTNE